MDFGTESACIPHQNTCVNMCEHLLRVHMWQISCRNFCNCPTHLHGACRNRCDYCQNTPIQMNGMIFSDRNVANKSGACEYTLVYSLNLPKRDVMGVPLYFEDPVIIWHPDNLFTHLPVCPSDFQSPSGMAISAKA